MAGSSVGLKAWLLAPRGSWRATEGAGRLGDSKKREGEWPVGMCKRRQPGPARTSLEQSETCLSVRRWEGKEALN